MKSNILKVIVIDDNLDFHEACKYYFEKYLDYHLSGIYHNVEDALSDFDSTMPDIVVSEVVLPIINGVEGIAHFRKKDRDIKIIMISHENDFEVIKKAFKNGANGYLTKPVSKKRLHNALDSIKYNGATMGDTIAKKIISSFHRKSYDSFSERENQIIGYLCRGATYKAIADRLFVTPSTVNFHIQNIYLKLDVNSKTEALMKLQELE